MANEELKAQLRKKAREKAPDPIVVGEAPLESVRTLPDPASQRIEPEKEILLHSIICRAGYQRNVHRTEGISFRQLLEDLKEFFAGEMAEEALRSVDHVGVFEENVDVARSAAALPAGDSGDSAEAGSGAADACAVFGERSDASGSERRRQRKRSGE